eukprot:gene13809-biopygen6138
MLWCMDLLLVAGSRGPVPTIILTATTAWLLFTSLDDAIGFVDVDHAWIADKDRLREGSAAKRCDCAAPPCPGLAADAAYNVLQIALPALLLDYFFTRRFAEGMRAQMEVVAAAADVSGRIAALLAAYAVDEAQGQRSR